MKLHNATIEALEQVTRLVTACEGPLYNQPSHNSLSGVGRHVRHILDHFLTLFHDLDRGEVDYNLRHRDSGLEDSPSLVYAMIDDLKTQIMAIPESLLNAPLGVISEISLSSEQSLRFESSLARELCYLINHTVHHVAYAKLVAMELGIVLDEHLGVAPSTATYLRGQRENA
jgi:hypothetical protein